MFQKGVVHKTKRKPTGNKKKRADVNERSHMGEVAALGCICCAEVGIHRPAQVHHLRHGDGVLNVGISVRSQHYRTIPLCPMHHDQGPVGVAFHAAPRLWRWDEIDLLERTWNRLIRERIIPEGLPVGTPYEPCRRIISGFSPPSRFSSPGGYGLGS